MLDSPSSIFLSLDYLFQKESSTRSQALPNAPFSIVGAVNGGEAFTSPLAPDQRPKKRKIYLDYNSTYRLWRPEQIALTIAKLQQEDFEVAFIQNDVNGNIFASSIEDKAEGDSEYDYKFKDKNGKEISIFEFSEDFIKENFSKIDHEKSIERLGLVRDESVILNFEQFEQIYNFFAQEYEKNKFTLNAEDEYRSHIDYITSDINNDVALTYKRFSLLLKHKDFDIDDSRTLEALNHLAVKLQDQYNIENFLDEIKNEKILEALFDKIPSLSFFGDDVDRDKNAKIFIQKSILRKLWFKCSDFETVVSMAKTLDEYKGFNHEDIANSIYLEFNDFNSSINSSQYPVDIFERCSIDNLFPSRYYNDEDLNFHYILTIAKQKKDDISVDFNSENFDNDNKIKITTSPQMKIANKEFHLQEFIRLFSNSEINQYFNLNERFGDIIIESFNQKTLLEICNSINYKDYPKFLEQLNKKQKTKFFDILFEKIEKNSHKLIYSEQESFIILGIIQHNLDQPKIAEFVENYLINYCQKQNSKPEFKYDLNPKFQDLIFELHSSNKIRLDHALTGSSTIENIIRPNFYSYAKKQSSPLQISIDLNEKSLKGIKTKIDSGELDPSKILSINILGAEKENSGAENDKKENLLTEFIKLFPNLKHARIDTKDIDSKSFDIKTLNIPNLETYNSSETSLQPIQPSNPTDQRNFTATKKGDAIFMGDSNSSKATKNDSQDTFSMKESGKIINRPAHCQSLLNVRNDPREMNPNFARLQDNLFIDFDKSQTIPTTEIQKFSSTNFEEKKTELGETSSPDKTICSFSKTLEIGKKTVLPSISPNNKIIGYYSDPSLTDVEFLKDEESGFYYAQTNKSCKIDYIIEGKELQLKEVNDQDLKGLDLSVATIIEDYVGKDKGSFLFSVKNNQYELPEFTTKDKFLDDLFTLENKGSCRHRVASLAHKFEKNELQCGKDFRIIRVNGNHLVLEVKKTDNSWLTLDLGGAQANLKSLQIPTPPKIVNSPKLLPITQFSNVEKKLKELRQLLEIKDLRSFETTFIEFITNKDSLSLYSKTTNSEELKNYLLRISSASQDSTSTSLSASTLSFGAFYISSPQNLTVRKPTIHIKNDTEDLEITDTTSFSSFLQNAKKNPTQQQALIIDWSKFNASEKVAFNTMFDQQGRKIDGAEIPDNVKIICIDDSKQEAIDTSILSRFNRTLDVSMIKKVDLKLSFPSVVLPNIKTITFDGEGFFDWKEKLFGRFVVKGDKMEWQKSDFVKSLEDFRDDDFDSKNLQLDFKNFSTSQQQEIKLFFQQAQASGSIDYHDYKIKIPRDLTLNFVKKEFEFENILKSFVSSNQDSQASSLPLPTSTLKIYKDVQASQILPPDTHLINSFLFNQLLIQPKIEDGQYQEERGLIAQASQSSSKTLKLYLSEDLSSQQFYCLLNQAQKHQVSLELSLAKGVKILDRGFNKFVENELIVQEDSGAGIDGARNFSALRVPTPISSSPSKKPPRITIANNIEDSLNSLKKSLPSPTVVNVEDVLYSDLFEKTQHQLIAKDDAQHFDFVKIESDLKTKLDAGETVILKGEFSDELLSLLHPQILDLQQQYSNLYFIIEDKNISKHKPQSSKLSWLDPSLYELKHSSETAKIDKEIVREDYSCVEDKISSNSKNIADDFIKKRKEKLSEFFLENPILQIFGHSGVGKSSLLREIEKSGLTQAGDVTVYNELSNFEAWAKNSEGRTKILVIDEFNVDGSTHFTMFRDLANNPTTFPQTIFHDGKSYELDKNHKVVFIGNPPNYGNRFKQKLFEDCQIPEWHLQDFPVDYIYENILKTPIYDGYSNVIKAKIDEEKFKEIAIEQITAYKAKNQGLQADEGMHKETVRELQEKVLKKVAKEISPIETKEVQNANFIATTSNQESIDELQSAIQIRQLQKQGELQSNFLGTCGVIFEGDSGVGKSVMIEAVLENRGITKIDSLENLEQKIKIEQDEKLEITPATKPHYYYKISASLPIEEIKQQLFKAFELGVIVVFDEMNTRIKDGGLEKTINALLTGQHPENPNIKPQAGFMLIASVNKATNSGRSAFSPAIKHRCNIISAMSLREYKQEDFEKIIGNWEDKNTKISPEIRKEFATQIQDLAQKDPNLNLRDLKKITPKILEELKTKHDEKILAIV